MAKKKKSQPAKSTQSRDELTEIGMAGGRDVVKDRTTIDSASSRVGSIRQDSIVLPAEVVRGDWTVVLFSLMAFFTPALGVPHEEMLQDTLKSIIASFVTLVAAFIFFWQQRNRRSPLRWHMLMWLPILLMFYALGSMVWSHTYLAGVEAIRWFVFAVILWLGLNTLSREKLPLLAIGIHWGAVIASLWTALQFWVDFKYFPQGPNPASTFVNRNFFAEFAVCTIPFSTLLLIRARGVFSISLYAFTTAFVIVAVLMTGTRGALTAMWLECLLILPTIAYIYRRNVAILAWTSAERIAAIGVLLATLVGLGLVPTNNPKLIEEAQVEGKGMRPIERALKRTAKITVGDGSLGVRFVMWKATLNVIKARPVTGVGAGAWESDIPLYQAEGAQLETDYYVHNETLQLLAEYGLVGWIFLLVLFGYLMVAAWRTLRNKTSEGQQEAPFRAIALTSFLALYIVSNVGFPWRLASTGVLFALCLAILAASDARLGYRGPFFALRMAWSPTFSQLGAISTMICLALAAFITQQAAECESKIVKATKIALTITQSGEPNNPKWDKSKQEMLRLIKEGTDINPHYRKITPMVADELAKWGDWKNATWIWESVISSRPYVVAIMANVARGYATTGNPAKALEYLERAKKVQPRAPSVRSLEVVLLSRSGREKEALVQARDAMKSEVYDYDLVNSAFVLGWRAGDFDFATNAMEIRMKNWPDSKAFGLIQLGNMYTTGPQKPAQALEYFKQAMAMTPETGRQGLLAQIPPVYWPKLGFGHITPVLPNQTSSTKK